jgi:hypothetical protein
VQVSPNAYFIYQKVKKLSVDVHTPRVLQPRVAWFSHTSHLPGTADGMLPYSR